MNNSNYQDDQSSIKKAIEIAINLSLITFIMAWSFMILSPFISVIIWAGVIAIAIHTPFQKLTSMLGGSKKYAVILITLTGLGILIVPAWMFGSSIIESSAGFAKDVASGSVQIPPPAEAVKDWPLIGNKAYETWSSAAGNFTAFLQANAEQVKAVTTGVLGKIAGAGIGVLQMVVSMLIAAAFLSNSEAVTASMQRLFRRLAGAKGDKLQALSLATIRSVAVGVIGIALIQAVLAGIGMMVVGVPAAGLWALLVLVVAIAQLPPWLVLGPVIAYVFSVEPSSTVATVFMIWSLIVSFLDMALKPVMLGRGVEAPMLVILLGAIGGMVMSGIIGLFIGAVILAMAYKLFEAWLAAGDEGEVETEESVDAEAEVVPE